MGSPNKKSSKKGSGSTRGYSKNSSFVKPIKSSLKLIKKTPLKNIKLLDGTITPVVELKNGYVRAKNIGFRYFFDSVNLIKIKHKTIDANTARLFIQNIQSSISHLQGGASSNNSPINPYIGTQEDVEEVNRLIKLGFVEGLYLLHNVGIITDPAPFFNFFPRLFEQELQLIDQDAQNQLYKFMGSKILVYNNNDRTQLEEGKKLYIQEFDPQAPRPNQRLMITRVFNDDDLKFFLDAQGKINTNYFGVNGDEVINILQELQKRFPDRVDLRIREQLEKFGL